MITGICVLGIAAGVWLIITVLSVMNGFERTWRDEIIGNRAHFTVHSGLGPFRDYEDVVTTVEAHPDVLAAMKDADYTVDEMRDVLADNFSRVFGMPKFQP